MEHTVSVNSKAVETKWGWQVYTRMMNGDGFIPQGSPHKTLELAIADCKDFDAPPPPGPLMDRKTLSLYEDVIHRVIDLENAFSKFGVRPDLAVWSQASQELAQLKATVWKAYQAALLFPWE